MLSLTIGDTELFDESTMKFITRGGTVVEFEHSLISLSKWESKHQKPFLSGGEKTDQEILTYIQCMIISPGVSPEIVFEMDQGELDQIQNYIDSKQTATTFNDINEKSKRLGETITAELIYYWMTAFQIPWEAEHWHLNRLFTLVKICSNKNQKPKKMSPAETAARMREINAQRRRELGTRG